MFNEDNDTSDFIAYLTSIQLKYSFYSFVIVANMGFLANLMNILTFVARGKKFSKNTMRFYNLLISASNILALIASYVYFFPNSIGMQSVLLTSNLNCILISYALRVFFQLSSWLNVMTTLDRVICLTYHHNKFKWITDTRKLSRVALGIFAGLVLVNSPNAWFKLQLEAIAANKTKLVCTTNPTIVRLRDLLGVSMRFAVPLVFEVVLNVVLVYKLIEQKKCVRSRDMAREYRYAVSVLVLNALYLATETPNFVMTIYLSASGFHEATVVTTRFQALMGTAYTYSVVLILYRCACVFFVNLLVNKVFRRELFSILISAKVRARTWTTHFTHVV